MEIKFGLILAKNWLEVGTKFLKTKTELAKKFANLVAKNSFYLPKKKIGSQKTNIGNQIKPLVAITSDFLPRSYVPRISDSVLSAHYALLGTAHLGTWAVFNIRVPSPILFPVLDDSSSFNPVSKPY